MVRNIELKPDEKIVYNRANILIKAGSRSFSDQIGMDNGICVGVKVIEFSGANIPHAVNIGVKDNQGTTRLEATDYRDYSASNSGYVDSYKPTSFSTANRIRVEVSSEEDLAKDFNAQMIFMCIMKK